MCNSYAPSGSFVSDKLCLYLTKKHQADSLIYQELQEIKVKFFEKQHTPYITCGLV